MCPGLRDNTWQKRGTDPELLHPDPVILNYNISQSILSVNQIKSSHFDPPLTFSYHPFHPLLSRQTCQKHQVIVFPFQCLIQECEVDFGLPTYILVAFSSCFLSYKNVKTHSQTRSFSFAMCPHLLNVFHLNVRAILGCLQE